MLICIALLPRQFLGVSVGVCPGRREPCVVPENPRYDAGTHETRPFPPYNGVQGFAAGVMLAASYWSLLAPAIEIAEESPLYGPEGRWAFFPAAIGFGLGAFCMLFTERLLPYLGLGSKPENWEKKDDDFSYHNVNKKGGSDGGSNVRRRKPSDHGVLPDSIESHSIDLMAFHSTGLQNFPEGLAVSMPLRREGMPPFKAFMWGQLSGVVEPIGGLIGAAAVLYVQPILPYALSFAAGAMIFVVVDDLIPEAHQSGNSKLATIGTIVGFIVMMTMDVALG
ncbi:hypothetical protein DYB32_009362 [Aphanomyces invadans]|uniref:Zinc transporter ZIP11 n=1 Tax=Aphanomyces invadans TaxID=157072 RepID=A0A418AIT6_9STRA|nr:hypothetical protein DYB32_009362 [Aphanomyces invadans]